MDLQKIIGYALAAAGLAGIIFSKQIVALKFVASLGSRATTYVLIATLIIAIIGAFIASGKFGFGGGKVKQAAEEVPIYEGTGKKRRIVGYRKG